jgi:hypothetical protein
MILIPLSLEKCVFPAGSVSLSTHLTSCTPAKSDFYLDSSLETVIREPALCKLLTFRKPNLTSVFLCLGRLSRKSVRVLGSLMTFVTNLFFYGEGLLAPRPTSKLEDHRLSFVQGCLFNVFAANIHSWRPSLYPRPEDAPCCGESDPPNMDGSK